MNDTYHSYEDMWVDAICEQADDVPEPQYHAGRRGLQGLSAAVGAIQYLANDLAYYARTNRPLARRLEQSLNPDSKTMTDILNSGDQERIDRNTPYIARQIAAHYDYWTARAQQLQLQLPSLPLLKRYADKWRNIRV